MKKLLALLTLAACTLTLSAADDAWLTDFAKARDLAKAQKKHVLLDFTGSDWCPPCKKLHEVVFSTDEFKKFAKDHLVLVELDFPRSKPQSPDLKAANRDLSRAFKIEGYPTVIVTDADGKELSRKVGFGGQTAAQYIAELRKTIGQ
jgi:protein disulfide-isomerase